MTIHAARAFALAWLAHQLSLLYTAVVRTCVRRPAGLVLFDMEASTACSVPFSLAKVRPYTTGSATAMSSSHACDLRGLFSVL